MPISRRRPRSPRDQPAVETVARGAGLPSGRSDDGRGVPSDGRAILAGYRLVRRLASGDRADVYLAVADGGAADEALGGGDRTVRGAPLVVMRVYGPSADDDAITTEIEAMDGDATGTLPRLIDVASLADGRGCLVVERIHGRSLSEVLTAGGLAPGQVVTALAPIVVGLGELADRSFVHSRLAASDVLLDATGRPRLLGLGALRRTDRLESAAERVAAIRDAHGALVRLLEDAAAASTDRAAFGAVLELARSALAARPFRRVDAELERALFAVAPAMPLLDAADHPSGGPTPARITSALRGEPTTGAPGPVEPPSPPTPARAGMARLATLAQIPPTAVDDLAAALDTDPSRRVARRITAWAHRRRPALLTGGLVGAAALVALLTAVPPSSTDDRADASHDRSGIDTATHGPDGSFADAPEGPAAHTPADDAATVPGPAVGDDPVAAAAALLEIRETCLAARDLDCVLAVAQPGSPIAARDRQTIEAGEVAATAAMDLDAIGIAAELGDAMVMTVPWAEGEREPASLLMMRSEAGWRLREWFD